MFEDGSIINELFIERLNYLIYVVLLLIGLHAMIAKNNLIKKLIGMSIFQTAIILFYVSIGVKEGASIPIYLPEHDPHGSHASHSDGNETEQPIHGPVVLAAELVKGYSNPLPHVLMLTAIVVGVATLGLALALCQRIYQGYGSIEEDEILAQIEKQEIRAQSRNNPKQSKPKVVAKKKPATSKSKTRTSPAMKKSSPSSKAKFASSTSKSPAAKPKRKPASRKAKTAPKSNPVTKSKGTTQSKSSPVKSRAKPAVSKSSASSKSKPISKAKSTGKPKPGATSKKTSATKPKSRTPKK